MASWRQKQRRSASKLSKDLWPEGKLTIVLLPSGSQGETLLQLAREWTDNGLLGTALWVRPENVAISAGSPPLIRAVVIGVDHAQNLLERSVDLFEILAAEPLRLVRLLKVRSASPSRELDVAQDGIAKVVSDYVGYSMPMANASENASTTRIELMRASVICAPTNFQLAERVEWAVDDSTITLVASPEDRATPWAGDAFVRDNARFPGFVLMHIATAGGLWSGLPIGSIELIDREASSPHSIYIPRVFVSGVMTEQLARRVAARVLDNATNPDKAVIDSGVGIPAAGTAIIPDAQADLYIDAMVNAAMGLDDGGLSYRRPAVLSGPTKDRIGIFTQIRLFSAFGSGKFSKIPHWVGFALRGDVSRSLDKSLQGEDGRRIVGIDIDEQLDSRDRSLVLSRQRLADSESTARATLAETGVIVPVRSTPRLWAGLRHLVFGSLDGSADLSEYGFAPIEDKLPVFGRVSDIVLDPEEFWSYPSRPVPRGLPDRVNWVTLRANPDLRSSLATLSDEAKSALSKAREDLARNAEEQKTIQASQAERESELLTVGALKFNRAGSVVVAPASKVQPPAEKTKKPAPDPDERTARAHLDEQLAEYRQAPLQLKSLVRDAAAIVSAEASAAAAVDHYEDVLASFDAWVSKNQRSFVWKLTDRMAGAVSEADRDLSGYESRIESLALPEAGSLVALRRRFHRGLIISWSIIVGLTALAVLLPVWSTAIRNWKSYPSDVEIIIAGIVLLIISVNALMVPYYRGWSNFERRISVAQSELNQLGEVSRQLRTERQRLQVSDEQATDWLQLLSTAMHHPFRINQSQLDAGLKDVDASKLPFALRIAHVSATDAASAARLEQAASEQFVKAGWRAEAFGQMLREIGTTVGLDERRFGADTLDNDLPHASNNSRALLARHMRSDDVLEAVGTKRLGTLVEGLQTGALYDASAAVMRVGKDPLADFRGAAGDGEESGESWIEFLGASLGASTAPVSALSIAAHEVQEGHHQQVQTYVIAPQRIAEDFRNITSEDVRLVSHHADSSKTFDVVVRVDMAGPMPVSAIRLWNEGNASMSTTPPQPAIVRPNSTGI